MRTDFNFENAKVGDEVYHVICGWLKIIYKNIGFLELEDGIWYCNDGKELKSDLNPTIYPYNPFEQNQERVIEVRVFEGDAWKRRVLIKENDGEAICWRFSETIEDSKKEWETTVWHEWREIQPKKQLTQQEKINILWEKYGKEL